MTSSAPLPAASHAPEATPSSTRRPALATTSKAYTPTVIRPNTSLSGGSRPAAPPSTNQIAIFVDGVGAGDLQGETESSPWPELGTRKSRTKENIPEVKKMAGTIIRQPGRAKRIAFGLVKSKIVPYRDPPPGDQPMPPPCDPPSRAIGKTPQKKGKESRIGDGAVELTPSFTPFHDGVRVSSLQSLIFY